jgi:hypothetical protein
MAPRSSFDGGRGQARCTDVLVDSGRDPIARKRRPRPCEYAGAEEVGSVPMRSVKAAQSSVSSDPAMKPPSAPYPPSLGTCLHRHGTRVPFYGASVNPSRRDLGGTCGPLHGSRRHDTEPGVRRSGVRTVLRRERGIGRCARSWMVPSGAQGGQYRGAQQLAAGSFESPLAFRHRRGRCVRQ